MVTDKKEGRRDALKGIGGLGAAFLLDNCGGRSRFDDYGTSAGSAGSAGAPGHMPAMPTATGSAQPPPPQACIVNPTLTQGPFWIDERLNRSDITSDTHALADPNPRPGLPLELRITALAFDPNGCTPIVGAQVDLWHCDATGLYSDAASITPGGGIPTTVTTGQNYLRGYQISDATGTVTFQTIYPGWYSGRAIHLHVRVRLFDAASNTTTEATTQLFFDDTVSDQVLAQAAPYNARPARDTRNATDGFFVNDPAMIFAITPKQPGDLAAGLVGKAAVGVQLGAIMPG